MRLKYLCIALLFGSCIFFGCKNVAETQVTIVDKGAVVPIPISTKVKITSHSIKYVSSQFEIITALWVRQIDPSDYNSVRNLIDGYNLLEMNDIILAEGQMPCDGWRGMTITIDEAGNSHSFDIEGVACRDQWPEGVRALVDLKDELVEKYQ
jgi:hypothetical protein